MTDQAGQTATASLTITLHGQIDDQLVVVTPTEPTPRAPEPTPETAVPPADPVASVVVDAPTGVWWAVVAVAVLLLPVRLSVLAPGELVPAQPIAIRAPLEGVIREFHVQTNENVKAGQPLFSYDEAETALTRSRRRRRSQACCA